jgi:hypothetical protein
VNFKDFSILVRYWFGDESSVDIAPPPFGDGMVDIKDLAVLWEHWLKKFLSSPVSSPARSMTSASTTGL